MRKVTSRAMMVAPPRHADHAPGPASGVSSCRAPASSVQSDAPGSHSYPCPRHRLRRSCVDLVLRPGVSCVPTCASSRRARRSGNTALSSCPQTYGANTPITILKFTGSGNYSITRPTTTDDPRTYALIHKQYTAAPCAPPLDRRTLQG